MSSLQPRLPAACIMSSLQPRLPGACTMSPIYSYITSTPSYACSVQFTSILCLVHPRKHIFKKSSESLYTEQWAISISNYINCPNMIVTIISRCMSCTNLNILQCQSDFWDQRRLFAFQMKLVEVLTCQHCHGVNKGWR